MTKIENAEGQPYIGYQLRGNEADYAAQLKAMVGAVASDSLDEDERATLAAMLKQMLPNANQLKLLK